MENNKFKHQWQIQSIILILGVTFMLFGCGVSINYHENPLRLNMDQEGPYVFYKNDSVLSVNYIRGNRNNGFYLEQSTHPIDSTVPINCYFPLDSTYFDFDIRSSFEIPKSTYNDDNVILAISDIESGYKAFRDFLINNNVIDDNLNWTFGGGHLVLVGDFIDRGSSATQVLWFIYKLEQEAEKHGGLVHYILGNHELKNLQGQHRSAELKYYGVAAILGKLHHELYDSNSFIGKWLESKNTIELINGNLFAHGGAHPDLANSSLNLDEINQIVRKSYHKIYYPQTEPSIEQFLNSTRTGIAWYRGYFKDPLTQEQIDRTLDKFNAKSVIVGHTLQSKVNRKFNGKVIAIDVHHPKDYRKSFPNGKSEGLMIKGHSFYRVFSNGELKDI